jgi:DNA modification methylase
MQIRDRIKELRRVKASDLIPNPKNWRTHPVEQQDALRGVLAEVGYADALLARETADGLMLVDGHLRAETTPDSEVPVLVLDIDEAEADLMLATLDPLAAMAGRDEDRLSELLATVTSDNATVNALLQTLANGYEPLTLLEPEPPDEGFDVDDALDDIAADDYDPTVQRGEVWSLGQHRLMCGDATSEENVVVLMGDETPSLMVTDPPYGVSLDQGWRDRRGINGLGHAQNDQLAGDDSANWLGAWMLSPAKVAYIWSAPGPLQLETGAALQKAGFALRQQVVWVKTMAPLSRSAYHWKHEPCWYAVREGSTASWRGGHAETTVWEMPSPKHIMGGSKEQKHDHPTQKPLECMERPINNHEGDVYDPFAGSGTTIIAAERLGRRCYAMEIEPRYCDVAIKRWEDYTGQKAVKV